VTARGKGFAKARTTWIGGLAVGLAVFACAPPGPDADSSSTTQGSGNAGSGADASSGSNGAGGSPTGAGGGATSGGLTTTTTSGAGGASTSSSSGVGAGTTTSSSGSGAGGPCKTDCLGNECGFAMPDLCGGTLDCGDCGSDTDYCIKLDPPVFRNDVRDAIIAAKSSHPEVFDLSDTIGSENIRVVDPLGYRDALLEALVGWGFNAVADPNDSTEIRIRGVPDEAENYHVLISSGYSAYTYTSTCTPANF
jgi:hypothetical protein